VQDVPGHAALIALRGRIGDSPADQRLYAYAPNFGPYTLFRIAGEALRWLAGPVYAARILCALPTLLLPGSVLAARRLLFPAEPPSFAPAMVALALALGFSSLLGLSAYLDGLALFVVALALWLRNLEAPTKRRTWILSALGVLLYLTHGHAFLLAGFSAFVTLFLPFRGARSLGKLWVFVPGAALGLFAAWLSPAAAANARPFTEVVFRPWLAKLGLAVSATQMTRFGVDTACGLVLLVLVAVAVRKRAKSDLQARRLAIVGLSLLGAFTICPETVGWFGWVDGRLLPPAFLLFAVGADFSAFSGNVATRIGQAVPVLTAAVLVTDYTALYRFQGETRGFTEVLGALPPDSAVLYVPEDTESRGITADPFRHFDKYALARGPVAVGDLWAHVGTAIYPRPGHPLLGLPLRYQESSDKHFDFPFDHAAWEYLLVRGHAAPRNVPADYREIESAGAFRLFRRR
jgi:hypothetical protein